MKIEIKKDVSTLSKQYTATFGNFEAKGKTQTEAKENMICILEWFSNNAGYPQTIIKQLPVVQRTLILERSSHGYSVIVSYQTDEEGIQESISSYGRISHTEALERLESHLNCYRIF